MYLPTIIDLKQFYNTPAGQTVWRAINRTVVNCWPEVNDESILGIGFTTPYMERFQQRNNRIIACMPSSFGALYWPAHRDNKTALVQEHRLPLPAQQFNRVLVVHAVEYSNQLPGLMQELWRVLTPGGRVLIIAPNRRGFWSHTSDFPLGHGRPFTLGQLRSLLAEHKFTYLDCQHALYSMPSNRKWWRYINPSFELLGAMFWPMFGGIIAVEAEKQIYASLKKPVHGEPVMAKIPRSQPAAFQKKKQ